MEETYKIQLSKVIEKFDLETLYLPELPENIFVDCSRVNRPGLQIAADYYHTTTSQVNTSQDLKKDVHYSFVSLTASLTLLTS